MERALIVYNPRARTAPKREALQVAALSLRPSGWHIDLHATEGPGHGRELAQEAALAGCSVVFACGGDGTINEVVNGLAGSDAALGIVRGGMGNVLAKEFGVPRNPEQALKVLLDGRRRRFDLGLAGERYFLAMAGAGFDATVVDHVPGTPKKVMGTASYVLLGLPQLFAYRPRRVRLLIDGKEKEVDLFWLLLGNTRSYGGVIDITQRAVVDDGLLDTYAFTGRGPRWITTTALRLALKRVDGAAGVAYRRAKRVEIATPGVPLQVDGEFIGESPVTFTVAPRALTVLLPHGKGGHLFSQEAEPARR
jgi:diacylglycerol kinase (ATP)